MIGLCIAFGLSAVVRGQSICDPAAHDQIEHALAMAIHDLWGTVVVPLDLMVFELMEQPVSDPRIIAVLDVSKTLLQLLVGNVGSIATTVEALWCDPGSFQSRSGPEQYARWLTATDSAMGGSGDGRRKWWLMERGEWVPPVTIADEHDDTNVTLSRLIFSIASAPIHAMAVVLADLDILTHPALQHRLSSGVTSPVSGMAIAHSSHFQTVMQTYKIRSYGRPAIIYSCTAIQMCGGIGDRFNAIVSLFLLAIVSNKPFKVQITSPMYLSNLFDSEYYDTAGVPAPSINLMHPNATLEEMPPLLRAIMAATGDVRVLSNHRFTRWIAEGASVAYSSIGLETIAFLASELWWELFRARPLVRERLMDPLKSYIGIHFRAGNESAWADPPRHGIDAISDFITCARLVEDRLGQGPMKWLLLADTVRILENAEVLELIHKGKVVTPLQQSSPSHIDRSAIHDAMYGSIDAYAQWLELSLATGLVISQSLFSQTAAEVGKREHVYIGSAGCVRSIFDSI